MQVLSPIFAARGPLFGSIPALRGHPNLHRVDKSYYDAPGVDGPLSMHHEQVTAHSIPLTGAMHANLLGFPKDDPPLPPVTIVFASAEGGKHYSSTQRNDAAAVHDALLSIMRR